MTRLIAALALASISFMASAADKPLPVTVANPVLPVEIRNADPVPVENVASANDYWGLSQPTGVLVLKDGLGASERLLIGTVTVSNGTTSPTAVQIQARRWVNGACIGTPTIYDSMVTVHAAPGETKSLAFPLPVKFPGKQPDGEWCLAAATSDAFVQVSVVAR